MKVCLNLNFILLVIFVSIGLCFLVVVELFRLLF